MTVFFIMAKPLGDMTLKKLRELFPIILCDYDPCYPAWYEGERRVSSMIVTPIPRAKRSLFMGSQAPQKMNFRALQPKG